MTVSSKIRIYDLAKELKLDTKRLIEEVRREGVDVSVPSNSVSKELAEKIRNKYFPKKETAVKRGVKVVKRAARPQEEPHAAEIEEPPTPSEPETVVAAEQIEPVAAPQVSPTPPKPLTTARLVKRLTPAARAEQPSSATTGPVPAAVPEAGGEMAPTEEAIPQDSSLAAEQPSTTSGSEATPASIPAHQIRVMRPTAAAL